MDTNVLVYAHREDSPFHERARSCLDSLADGRAAWAIPCPCLHEFLSIATHPRIYDPPAPFALALDQIDAWLEAPSLVLLAETESHWRELPYPGGVGPRRKAQVQDARIAALCRQHVSANCGRRIAISVGSLGSTSATHS